MLQAERVTTAFPQPFYLAPADICGGRLRNGAWVMGVAAFGAGRPPGLDPHCPFVQVALPLLEPGPCLEVWASATPATWQSVDGISFSRAQNSLFGVLELDAPESGGIEALAFDAYRRIFALADSAGCPNLVRIFNYLPRITALENGMERYRLFNAGRHAAFEAAGRALGVVPAACALGTQGGGPVIYFLAAAHPGRPIENPRQISAYHYPPQYGHRRPRFSRAMLAGDPPHLFVSGTASIVGHESVHLESAAAQVDETLRNIEALFDTCGAGSIADHAGSLRLKVYIRRRGDLAAVQARLAALPRPACMMFLQADICRPELLLEIEASCDVPTAA